MKQPPKPEWMYRSSGFKTPAGYINREQWRYLRTCVKHERAVDMTVLLLLR